MTTRTSKSTTAKQGTPKPKANREPKEQGQYTNPPETLDKHWFYGIIPNEEQKIFRDAIWKRENLITFVNSCAGSGKSLIAVATANLMVEYGLFDEIIYITSPCHEWKQGFLSGSLDMKSMPYFYPLFDALYTIGKDPSRVVHTDDVSIEKFCSPYVTPMTDTYIRGRNFGNSNKVIVICDECQNMTTESLRTLLSRVCSGSICIAIGHSKQVDLIGGRKSGFEKCIEHFKDRPWATICTLTKNYRGEISRWADMLPKD